MKLRTCHWCGKKYDPEHESSIWCEKNPHRGRGASRRKNSIVTIGPVLILPPSPFAPRRREEHPKADH